ncbi:MAG: BACON domain-containing protein, partial [Bacteroidales bacterium]|nr:BACON domain-containing protein [Bacteroidales bacterium]
MKKFVLLAVTALVGLTVFSCKQKEIEPEDALSIAGTTITVGKEAATPAVTFTANKAWTAQSDSQWIVPDQTSGEAGTVNLKIAVAENDTWAERSGKVTVAVGELKTVFTIVQGTESIMESALSFSISPDAQDILVPVKTNLTYTVTPAADSPWITVVSTKAAPQEGTIKIHVAANTKLAPRTGSFVIAAPGYSQTYTVVQDASWTPAESASAIYIANSQSIYDSETWAINLHQQYVVKLATEAGDQVTLVLNKKGQDQNGVFQFFPVDKVPQGKFEIDASGKKDDNTFSIMSSDGSEKYYTGIIAEGREIIVYDGEIVVEEADGNYTITAILVDATGAQHNYSYVGPVAISTDFFGGQSEVNWKNTFNTHFTTKANGWYVSFYHPRKNPADKNEVAYSSFEFYSAAGDVNLEEFPVGTYTFGAAENDPGLKYKNGILKADPGLLASASVSLYNEAGGITYTNIAAEGSKLTVSKNADGTYNFKYSATVTPYHYDESYNVVNGDPVQVSIDIDTPLGKATDTQT